LSRGLQYIHEIRHGRILCSLGHDGICIGANYADLGLDSLDKAARRARAPILPLTYRFILSTASGVLAVSAIVYAVAIHGFPFYDPTLLRIYAWGFLLSAGGIVLGLTGVSAPNALRWHAPLAGLGTLAFWMIAAATE